MISEANTHNVIAIKIAFTFGERDHAAERGKYSDRHTHTQTVVKKTLVNLIHAYKKNMRAVHAHGSDVHFHVHIHMF